MSRKIYPVFFIILVAGCATQSLSENPSDYDISYVSERIKELTDYELGQISEPGQFNFPEWVSLEDGLSLDEAVAVALWNNAQFQSDLLDLGFARAELLEANMLSNPVFSILFPVAPKLLETSLEIPINALWQRPRRVAVAELDAQRISDNLIRNGLGLIRDVQITYAELFLAQERVMLAAEDAQLQVQITQLDQARLKNGEISELVASASYVDMLRVADAMKQYSKDAEILEQRLNSLLGVTQDDIQFDIVPLEIGVSTVESVDEMLEMALVCRPDLRAAELAIEAAGERIGWEKSKVYNFIAVLDGDDTDDDSFTVRPGFSVEIPVFDRNEAGIAQAQAQLKRATQRYEAVRQSIILHVQQSYTQYVSACEQFELWSNDIIPTMEQTLEQTQKSYEAGDISFLEVLQAQRQLVEARMHQTELAARLHVSAAELNYSIGKKMI